MPRQLLLRLWGGAGLSDPYTWSSRTIDAPSRSSGRYVFSPHLRRRSRPTCVQRREGVARDSPVSAYRTVARDCASGPRIRESPPTLTHQNVPLRVLVCQERFPATVGDIVSPDQLHLSNAPRERAPPAQTGAQAGSGALARPHARARDGRTDLVWPNFAVNVDNANFARAHVPAGGTKVAHAGELQLAQVAVLHSRRHQRHWDVAAPTHAAPPKPDAGGGRRRRRLRTDATMTTTVRRCVRAPSRRPPRPPRLP